MKKFRVFLQKQKNTTRFQLTFWYMIILFAVVFLMGAALISLISYQLYQNTVVEADSLKDRLTAAESQSKTEWQRTVDSFVSSDHPRYYIRVTLASGEQVYSSETAELLEDFDEWQTFVLLKNVLWEDRFEPYYVRTFQKNGVKFLVLADMENVFDTIEKIIFVIVAVMIFSLIAGSLVTYRFSKKMSRPLLHMMKEINSYPDLESLGFMLTEPQSPQEVHDVSVSFNQLLSLVRKNIQREKRFIADASHELRTPLAAIRGHANLIRRRSFEHPEVLPKSLDFIDKESKRMQVLVEQLLTLSRFENGPIEYEDCDLSAICLQTAEEMQELLQQRFTVKVAENIHILGNSPQLRRVVQSLLDNAQKYTASNGTIKLTLTRTDKQAQLCVADSGRGIPDNEKKMIFERFYRADPSRSSEIPGTGLGLAIVKESVLLHKVEIKVMDAPDQGSIFVVTFPLG